MNILEDFEDTDSKAEYIKSQIAKYVKELDITVKHNGWERDKVENRLVAQWVVTLSDGQHNISHIIRENHFSSDFFSILALNMIQLYAHERFYNYRLPE